MYLAEAGVLSSESLSSSRLECPAGVFLRERESGAIAVERSLVSSNWASLNRLADPLGSEQLEL